MYTITNVHLYPLPVNKKSGAFSPAFFPLFPVFAYTGPAAGFLCRNFDKARVLKEHILYSSSRNTCDFIRGIRTKRGTRFIVGTIPR